MGEENKRTSEELEKLGRQLDKHQQHSFLGDLDVKSCFASNISHS
jgi:hypothetical protein